MVPSQRSQPDFVGDDAAWPSFDGGRAFKAIAASVAAIASYLAIVEFLFPSLSEADSSERRWQIIGILIFAALVYAVWPWISVAKRRIQQYVPVRASAIAQQREIDRILLENRSLINLIMSIRRILNLLDRVEVVRAVAIGDEVLLAVEPRGDVQLSPGDEIVVIDGDTGAPLGIFLCSQESSASTWFAKGVQIYAPVWWGFMRETAETRAVPTIQIIGLVNRRKVHHDVERPT